jgi:hypothetical protein
MRQGTLLIVTVLAAGCQNPQASYDPFLGRTTVPPPGPVQVVPQGAVQPSYQQPGAPFAPAPPMGGTTTVPGVAPPAGAYGYPQSSHDRAKVVRPGPDEYLAGPTTLARRAPVVQELKPRDDAEVVLAQNVVPVESSGTGSRYGHEPNYAWIRGKLEYLESKRSWKLRYIPIDGETDQYGGSVTVSNDALADEFKAGDFVEARGAIESEANDTKSFAPAYRVQHIRRLDAQL